MKKFSTPLCLAVQDLTQIRRKFTEQKQDLAKGVLSGDDEKNQIVLELHFLMNDLNEFFDQFLDTRKEKQREKEARLFSGQMPVIPEGSSEKQISSSKLQNQKGLSSKISSHEAEKQKRKDKTSIDNLHQLSSKKVHTVTPQKSTEYEEILFKYQRSESAISNLKAECASLQKTISEYKSNIVELSKRNQQFQAQKRYCLDLLVKHTNKSQKLESENRHMRDSLCEYQEKCKELSQQVIEKSELLDEIRQFLKTEDGVSESNKAISSPSELDEENERLSAEISNINQKLEMLIDENNCLGKSKVQLEQQVEVLMKDNRQFYQAIGQLTRDLKAQRNKNRQQVKIEQGKMLNDLVHKQNKHLLELNYSLSNQIYEIKKSNEELILRLKKSQNRDSCRKSANITEDETMNCNNNTLCKSKFSNEKNNTGQSFFNQSAVQAEDKSLYYEQNWRMEKDKNRELEGKVTELLHEMEAYEDQLDKKRKQIDALNLSLSKRNNTSVNESRAANNKSQTQIDEVIMASQNTETKLQDDNYMSLEQFSRRFEPSLMDILFIMLRISELADLMINNGKIYGVFPSNVFLVLDDPDRPENIHVKILKQENLLKQQTFLFEAPQIVMNEVRAPNQFSLIWNIGMIFYYLIYKQPYFSTLEEFIDQENHVQLSRQKFLEAENIIQAMLERDPEIRISLKEVLEGIAIEINKMFAEE